MLKTAVVLLLIPFYSFALSFKVQDPCSSKILFEKEVELGSPSDLAALTLDVLNQSDIPFDANVSGVKSIFNTPVGLDALDVISDSQMRAYGWCYKIDGEVSEQFAYEQMISSLNQSITWYYGYAYYSSGLWYKICQDDVPKTLYCD